MYSLNGSHISHTVDGTDPAPVDRQFISLFRGGFMHPKAAGFLPSRALPTQTLHY